MTTEKELKINISLSEAEAIDVINEIDHLVGLSSESDELFCLEEIQTLVEFKSALALCLK